MIFSKISKDLVKSFFIFVAKIVRFVFFYLKPNVFGSYE